MVDKIVKTGTLRLSTEESSLLYNRWKCSAVHCSNPNLNFSIIADESCIERRREQIQRWTNQRFMNRSNAIDGY